MSPIRPDDESTAELLRQALADEAARVRPAPDALQAIQQRIAESTPGRPPRTPRGSRGAAGRSQSWRVGAALGAGVATAAVITAVVVVSNHGGNPGRSPVAAGAGHRPTTASTSIQPTSANSASPTAVAMHPGIYDPSAPAAQQVTLYYVGRVAGTGQRPSHRLFSEQHTVRATKTPALAALHEFLTSTPLDRDYFSGWPSGVDVTRMTTSKGVTTIALTGTADLGTARHQMASGTADPIAVQALLATAEVRRAATFTYNGEPLDLLAHQSVVQREPDNVVRAWVCVTSPAAGQTVANPVSLTGSANVFEGNVNWDLRNSQGKLIDSGNAIAGFAEWKDFSVPLGQLRPGTYTVRAYESSPETGRPTDVDDKTFTVR
jgi:Immunoglobulin-like domain of bacterial spore germination